MDSKGKVYLVGAGPGDPGLISVKGLECLRRADMVLYDGLVNPLLLRHTTGDARRTCRTAGPDGRVLLQDEINARLVEGARAGKTVVRLKGGDPFIFGRGSEEAQALADAQIEFEVVPGITAATAASEYAGISLTRRDLASCVAFVTGHEDPAKEDPSIDYQNLAAFTGTLVFYMGLHRLPEIVNSLVAAGKDPRTPACVISRATTPEQQTVTAPLNGVAEAVADRGLRAPSIIVIGQCVRQRNAIAWFERRPLLGRRIAITRPAAQADPIIHQALELGAQPILLPTIQILPPEDWSQADAVLSRIHEFDWIVFTSANGVDGLLGRLWSIGGDARRLSRCRIAAIGPATNASLFAYRLRADLVPDEFRGEALAESLRDLVPGKRVLWARASRGRDVLPERLTAAGAALEQVVVYRNVDAEQLPEAEHRMIEQAEIDWIALSSPSIARSLKLLLGNRASTQIGNKVRLASISPVTSQAAREAGLSICAEATTYTWPGIFDAIIAAERTTA